MNDKNIIEFNCGAEGIIKGIIVKKSNQVIIFKTIDYSYKKYICCYHNPKDNKTYYKYFADKIEYLEDSFKFQSKRNFDFNEKIKYHLTYEYVVDYKGNREEKTISSTNLEELRKKQNKLNLEENCGSWIENENQTELNGFY